MAKALKRRFDDSWIPLGAYWSTPFVRWQGSFASAHPVKLAADVGRRALEACGVDPTSLDSVILGTTVPSKASFFGAPWYRHGTRDGGRRHRGRRGHHACRCL
jgi:hypothetical protein